MTHKKPLLWASAVIILFIMVVVALFALAHMRYSAMMYEVVPIGQSDVLYEDFWAEERAARDALFEERIFPEKKKYIKFLDELEAFERVQEN